jgi:phage terminase large subunit-like protein
MISRCSNRSTRQTADRLHTVVDQELTHDGGSPLARHVANAILREDSRGARLAKEHKDSPRRIDGAVAAVMAVHRAAELAGAARLDIYI